MSKTQAIKRKSRKILICGRSGTGKTEFFCRYLSGSPHDSVYIFDAEDEIGERLGLPDVSKVSRLEDIFKPFKSNSRFSCYSPSDEFAGENDVAFEVWAETIFELSNPERSKLVAVDELQTLIDPYNIPTGLKKILETGRRRGLDLIIATQQPNLLHNSLRVQATELVCFSLLDRALEFLKSVNLPQTAIDAIMTQPDLFFTWFDLKRGITEEGKIEY